MNRTLVRSSPHQAAMPAFSMGGSVHHKSAFLLLTTTYFHQLTPELLSYQVKVIVITVIYGNGLSFKP